MLNFILVSSCTVYIIFTFKLRLGLGSVLGLELGFRVKVVMVEVIWLNFISGPVT